MECTVGNLQRDREVVIKLQLQQQRVIIYAKTDLIRYRQRIRFFISTGLSGTCLTIN